MNVPLEIPFEGEQLKLEALPELTAHSSDFDQVLIFVTLFTYSFTLRRLILALIIVPISP